MNHAFSAAASLLLASSFLLYSCGSNTPEGVVVAPRYGSILIRPDGYRGNIAIDTQSARGMFYLNGRDTAVKLTNGKHFINTGATQGGETAPTAYIYFDVQNGKISKLYNTTAAAVSADGKALTFKTSKITFIPGNYKLHYYLSAFHVADGSDPFQGSNTVQLIKGILYYVNNSTVDQIDIFRSYFYFVVDSMGNVQVRDVLSSKFSCARTDGHTMIFGNTAHLLQVTGPSFRGFSFSGTGFGALCCCGCGWGYGGPAFCYFSVLHAP